jgi:hypothetical protein
MKKAQVRKKGVRDKDTKEIIPCLILMGFSDTNKGSMRMGYI